MAPRARRLGLDLDGTLIPEGVAFAGGLEPRGALGGLLTAERLRRGTRALVQGARRRGWSVWVYTSSMRSEVSVRALFLAHGLWIDGVINDQRHRREEYRRRERWPVKFPPAFGIEVLVDDSEAVEKLGLRHGFRVLRLGPGEERWVERVMDVLVGNEGGDRNMV